MLRSLSLPELRKRITLVDELLTRLLGHRQNLVMNVGALKTALGGTAVHDPEVESEKKKCVEKIGKEIGLREGFASEILTTIMKESRLLQYEGVKDGLPNADDDDEWYRMLKKNLLQLTERVAATYDTNYDTAYFATKVHREFEDGVIEDQLRVLKNHDLAVDLGCATGRSTFPLAGQFRSVMGYDISPAMINVANGKNGQSNVNFSVIDLDAEQIPLADGSVSFVTMNGGTASDIRDINRLWSEISRVLALQGRFMLSFYNRNSAANQLEFLPWPVSLAAGINLKKDCLDVHVEKSIYSIFAKAYSTDEIRASIPINLEIDSIFTHPTLSPLLPNCVFSEESNRIAYKWLDGDLVRETLGAYIVIAGYKYK